MIRAFASDHAVDVPSVSDPIAREKFEKAVDLAAKYALPLGWVLRAMEEATGVDADTAAKRIYEKVLAMGPPSTTTDAALAAYRSAALGSVGVFS